MFAAWDKAFKNYSVDVFPGLVKKAPILANQLFELRNDDAHRKIGDLSPFETETGLKKMSVLCRCFDEKTANEIMGLCSEISGKNPQMNSAEKPHDIPVKQIISEKKTEPEKTKEIKIDHSEHDDDIFVIDDSNRVPEIADVVKACIISAEDQLKFDDIQAIGKKNNESIVHIESYQFSGKTSIICRISEALVDNSEYVFVVNNRPFSNSEVDIPFYDKDEHTVVLTVTPRILEFIRNQTKLEMKLVGDLSFLVANVLQFYTDYGRYLSIPEDTNAFSPGSYPYPTSRMPTESQKRAIDTILNSGLSYIWGAPGTGKTQMVLATALVACVRAGQKVAVVAPTNLAVEQVLRGLIGIINDNPEFKGIIDPSRDILRLGMASEEFLREYPKVCETKVMQSVIDRKTNQIERLIDVPFERELERIADLLKEQQLLLKEKAECKDRQKLAELNHDITHNAHYLLDFFIEHNKTYEVGTENFTDPAEVDKAYLFARERSRLNKDVVEYFEWSEDARMRAVGRLAQEIEELNAMKDKVDNLNAKIIALTPHKFISRFTPRSYPIMREGAKVFDVDHIFLDEAGYCSAILALPLLSNGVPLTLLGDHKQLPPVCATNLETIHEVKEKYPDKFKDPEFMKYWYLWDLSSIYIDTEFIRTTEELKDIHDKQLPPVCRRMKVCSLKESYRFGKNLGEILDRTVYKNGITGIPGNNLTIEVLDVAGPTGSKIIMKQYEDRVARANICEVDAIREYIDNNPMDRRTFSILTPYRDQIKVLNDKLPEYAYKNIFTVHRSQGREWDTVILSVVDGHFTNGLDHPTRFTSIFEEGLYLINTAVSRAKKKLLIVCDTSYWSNKEGELITNLLLEARNGFGSHTVG